MKLLTLFAGALLISSAVLAESQSMPVETVDAVQAEAVQAADVAQEQAGAAQEQAADAMDSAVNAMDAADTAQEKAADAADAAAEVSDQQAQADTSEKKWWQFWSK